MSHAKSPAKNPRTVIWLGVAAVVLVILAAVVMVGTSTQWFCTEACHKVHADNTLTFKKSSHVMVSCVACHEPLNASPLTFAGLKMTVAPDMFSTIASTYELPMNENQSVAFAMPSEQCTQCHNLDKRKITASSGIIIDHKAHSSRGITCTSCHNRVAHPEGDVQYTLKGDKKHEDWMKMDACFRCHSLEANAKAPGKCSACHPANFDLVPTTHKMPGWYSKFGESRGHALAYSAEASRVAEADKWVKGLPAVKKSATAADLGYEQTVNTCYTCHQKQFCTSCHGVEMPHPASFATGHGDLGRKNSAVCAKCHARTKVEAVGQNFCNACHHPQGTPDKPWVQQHFVTVRQSGADQCFSCHNPGYCSACHVGGAAAAAEFAKTHPGKGQGQ